jgi:hypothetical protein
MTISPAGSALFKPLTVKQLVLTYRLCCSHASGEDAWTAIVVANNPNIVSAIKLFERFMITSEFGE